MKILRILLLLLVIVCESRAVPRPMESIENYNVLMVHGAYGADKGFSENREYYSAYEDTTYLGDATLGSYTSENRITRWLSQNLFEEVGWIDKQEYVRNSYIYN